MCGRYTLAATLEVLQAVFELEEEIDERRRQLELGLKPRFNIAPTEPVLLVRPETSRSGSDTGGQPRRRLATARWGQSFAFSGGRPLFNARKEKLRDRFWNDAFRSRRCLIPATSFYEWQDTGSARKTPWEISPVQRDVFAMAGVWSSVKSDAGEDLEWCSIITTTANPLMREIHNAGANPFRQPAVVQPADFQVWLNQPVTSPQEESALLGLLHQMDAEELSARPLDAIGNDRTGTEPVARGASPPAQSARKRPGAQPDQPGLPFG